MRLRFRLGLVAFLILAAAVLTLAPKAKADQWDFISALDNNGVLYTNIIDMINLGKGACHELRAGSDIDMMFDYLVETQEFTVHEAALIMNAAANTMCPDTRQRLVEYANG